MHYIDEGEGEPIVFVHGNPAWSFEFRHPVRELRSEFRCVALDHIGFGLSSRSARREDHRPRSHARRLAALLDHLDLRDITLFMNDWGGPIGLDFARRHPERVKRLVIANTWCWPVGDDFHFRSFSFLMSSWIGQYLLRQHNIFVNGVMPRAVGDRSVLTPEVMAHYRGLPIESNDLGFQVHVLRGPRHRPRAGSSVSHFSGKRAHKAHFSQRRYPQAIPLARVYALLYSESFLHDFRDLPHHRAPLIDAP